MTEEEKMESMINADAIKGYIIKTLKEMKKTEEEIKEIINKFEKIRNEVNEDKACAIYYDFIF